MNIKLSRQNVEEHYKAQTDFIYFCEEILGYKEDPKVSYKPLCPIHYTGMNLLIDSPKKNKMFLEPRCSIKSQIKNIGYILWRLVKNPELRVLIYSDSATKAQGFLAGVKAHIEGKSPNSKFREMYPSWETDPHKGGTYNESRVIIRPRKHSYKEPSIDTGGIESSKIGMHYDLIIFDDIVSDLNTTTKSQMDKIHDCYKKSLSLLMPGGETLIIGTRWHYGDAYGRIIDDNKEKENFELFITDAEDVDENGELIYAGVGLDREFLTYQRAEQGSYIFSCLYRNNPVDDETALFKLSNFQWYEPAPHFHENMFITGTCDPAGEGEDFTAITVFATDKDRKMYLLEAVCAHLTPINIIEHIIRLNYKWKFNRFSCERNFFKGMLEDAFRETEKEHLENPQYHNFHMSESLIASSKQKNFTRVLSLQAVHEKGMFHLPGKTITNCPKVVSDLAFQMLQFTIDGAKSPHDDLLMSTAFHVEIALPGGEAKPEEAPKTSAVWFETQMVEELGRAKMPSRYKQQYEPSFIGE